MTVKGETITYDAFGRMSGVEIGALFLSSGVRVGFLSSRISFCSSTTSLGLVEEEVEPSQGLDMTSEVSLLTGVGYWIARTRAWL